MNRFVRIYGLIRGGKIFYVGSTINVADRLRKHRNIEKKFDSHKVLKICKSENSIYWENYFMDVYNTYRSGVEGCNMNRSEGNGGRALSITHRKNISKGQIGRVGGFSGRKHSEGSKKQVKEIMGSKIILVYKDGEKIDEVYGKRTTAEKYGVNRGCLARVLGGKQNHAKGYNFKIKQ